MELKPNSIWTIGHSTRTFETFINLLKSVQIEFLLDVRNYPGSRRFPQFNKESLETTLPENKIQYLHVKKLGGRRKASLHSRNTLWRHPAFRGYADYMESDPFKEGIQELESTARNYRSAYMCSEAVWWRCHRSMISDYLKVHGWNVLHILDGNKVVEHPFTAPAKIINGELSYENDVKES